MLPFVRDDRSLAEYLGKVSGKRISLTITENSSSMVSMRKTGSLLLVRLHRMFLSADEEVLDEIALFIKGRKGRTPSVSRFIRENGDMIRRSSPRRSHVVTQGRWRDLRNIYETVNEAYFHGRINAAVTWVTGKEKYAVRKRTLGSYSSRTNIIRINRCLDKKTVPRYFLEFVVYHEMLHADMGMKKINGRRTIHSKEFRDRERLFRDYQKAVEWEKKGI
jgi:hypothetical protein